MKFSFRSWKTWALLIVSSVVMVSTIIFAYFPSVILHEITNRELVSLGMEVKEIWVDGARIHYAEGGHGTETLVLVHGFRSNMSYWLPYLPDFLPHYHVVMLDLPGHGGSSRPSGQHYDILSLGRSLGTFIDAKGLSHFYLLGTSMGGGVSLAFASENEQKIQKMALLNPLAVYPPKLSEVHEALSRGENILLPTDQESFIKMQEVVYGSELSLNFLFAKLFLNSMVQDRDFYVLAFNEMVRAGGIENVLGSVHVPVMVIQGDADRVVDPSSVMKMQEFISHMQVTWIGGGAHTFRGAHREKAIQTILAFFATPHES